jgi:hypothetical protein
VAQVAPLVVRCLLNVDDLSEWAAWEPWCESVAYCFDQLLLLDVPAAVSQPDSIAQLTYQAAMKLVIPASQVVGMATCCGAEALQQSPLPALLGTLAMVPSIDPAMYGCKRPLYAELHADAAKTACTAVAEAEVRWRSTIPQNQPLRKR